ncbi:MAG: hypothetical protein NXY59_08060 [Aigarchaeota archaeon]|nr:hypothetical protein [Candidatus Pelearchaeum maunauluense]
MRVSGLGIEGEGMGIGGVVALCGNRAVFPLTAEEFMLGRTLIRRYHMNGVSIKFIGRGFVDKPYKKIHSALAPLYVKSRVFRPFYYFLMAARTVANVRSRFVEVRELGYVDVAYRVDGSMVRVEVDASSLRCSRYFVANELSGRLFTKLLVDGRDIGRIPPWIDLDCDELELFSPTLKLGMKLRRVAGCKLLAGREVLGERLDWAGASYQPNTRRFSYEVVFKQHD